MRVGLLGGTFDPIHIGHLLLAEEVRLGLRLAQVWFVPAAQPWRKSDRPVSEAAHRRAMVALAIADNPSFVISDIELEREGPTYTADTLAQFRALLGPDDELWFILGSDALWDLPNWHQPARILDLARLAVVPREPLSEPDLAQLEQVLPGLRDCVDLVPMRRVAISSTELRRRLCDGISTRYWLPETVARYAGQHALYRRDTGTD